MAYGTMLAIGALCGVVGVTTVSITGRAKTAVRASPAERTPVVVQAVPESLAIPVVPAAYVAQPMNMPPRRVPMELTGS